MVWGGAPPRPHPQLLFSPPIRHQESPSATAHLFTGPNRLLSRPLPGLFDDSSRRSVN